MARVGQSEQLSAIQPNNDPHNSVAQSLTHGIDRERLGRIQRAGRFGEWARMQLFVSSSDAVTHAHFDHLDNIYVQLVGRKRFVIWPPQELAGLGLFPVSWMDGWTAAGVYMTIRWLCAQVHHALDQKVQLDLEAPPSGEQQAGRGLVHLCYCMALVLHSVLCRSVCFTQATLWCCLITGAITCRH